MPIGFLVLLLGFGGGVRLLFGWFVGLVWCLILVWVATIWGLRCELVLIVCFNGLWLYWCGCVFRLLLLF